ncbi:MAG TPA: NAD(P)-dependent oxidoreductase [Caldimonas sp.]|jgi:uronate dehydrogenase|nr:NAD(P)-dependent oxidoreductase [Caldimonas sp.]
MRAAGRIGEHRGVSGPDLSLTHEAAAPPVFDRLLLTGAAGGLGRELRPRLRRLARVLRSSDVAEMAAAGAGEEVMTAALQDSAAVDRIVAGSQAIVHLGGVSTEGPFAPILEANIVGVWNVYEAARRHRVRRVVFASSNHVTGFYRQDEVIAPADPMRPDGNYGLSKAFGENVARFYFDRYGIESVCLRIGSSFAEPKDRRMLATWLSYDDLERLVVAGLTAPVVGCSVVYGVSANTATWWDNTSASHLGFRPQDSSERFRAAAEARQPSLDLGDPATLFQGGAFVKQGPFER